MTAFDHDNTDNNYAMNWLKDQTKTGEHTKGWRAKIKQFIK